MDHQRALRRWFREYNERYFGGSLPQSTRVEVFDAADLYGQCEQWTDGSFTLRVNVELCASNQVAKATLLHEMAHLKLWPRTTHGRYFEQEMRRLAAAGAFKGLW